MRLISSSKNWQASTSNRPNSITVHCKKPLPSGWHYVELQAKTAQAKALINASFPLFLQQNHNLQGVEIRPVSSNRFALVFYRHSPLHQLSIQWPDELPSATLQGVQFKLKVRHIKAHRAWLHMLRQVSRYQRQQGQDWQYIYRITRARIKRAGREDALRKLVREYQPLLQHQLISCEPYTFWQRHFESIEPSPLEPISKGSPVQFKLIVRTGELAAVQRTLRSFLQQPFTQWQAYVDADVLPTEFVDHPQVHQIDPHDTTTSSQHWYMLLDAGDELSRNALHTFCQAINAYPKAHLHYADHDCTHHNVVNSKQQRSAPQFKPDWSPDYYYAMDYIGNACAMHGSILASLLTDNGKPWWRQSPTDTRDAFISLLPKERRNQLIHHISQVLYHQSERNSQDNHSPEGLQALLIADGQKVNQLESHSGLFRLHHELPGLQQPKVSLLVPTRDALEITRTCIESVLEKTDYPNYEIIILNNQSEEPATLEWFNTISQHPKVKVLDYNHPFNYSAINNFGVQHAKGGIIGLLNNDTEVINSDWLSEMVAQAARPEIGCVGAKLYYFDDTVQHGGVIVGLYGIAGHAHKNVRRLDNGYMNRLVTVQNFTAVTAACLLVRKSVYEEVGGLNETDLTVAFNDVDFCLKVHSAGYRNLWTPYAELYHYESKTRGADNTPSKVARAQKEARYMQQHWHSIIEHDPAYNPNLTRMREDFGVRLEHL